MGLFHVALLLCFIILNISSFKIGFKSQKYRINYSYTSLQSSVAGRDPRGAGGGRQAVPPPPINQYIKADKVRLLVSGNESGDGDVMIGVMPLAEAQEYADKLQVDLVLINDKGDPPVCKAIDYGKYKYSLEKKKKERAKKQVQSEIKEIKMSYKIEEHDYNVRLKAIQKFLSEGDKVKVVVQFKGRELQYKDLGKDLLLKLYQPLEDTAVMESPPKIEGRAIAMLIGPKKIT